MCTHLLLEAEGLADQVVVLEDGHALISGTPDELTARFWPGAVVRLDAEIPSVLDRLSNAEGVLAYERVDGDPATVQLDDMARVPDLVLALAREGVRLTRVEPHIPTLEDLYFAVRGRSRPGVVPRDQTPLEAKRLSSGNRVGRRFRDPFSAS
jgi:ABC-type multidrug transport system ATPase subunit